MGRALAWSARACAVGAWGALGIVIVWAYGMRPGEVPPFEGLIRLGWVGLALLWVRVGVLWIRRVRYRGSGAGRPVDPVQDAVPVRSEPYVPRTQSAGWWVYLRQGAVWVLLPLVIAVPVSLGEPTGGASIRALQQAGAEVGWATVVQVAEVSALRDADDDQWGYQATLVLELPDRTTVTATDAVVYREPRAGGQVRALWAPAQRELGAVVDETVRDPEKWVRGGWTWRGVGLLVAVLAIPLAAIAASIGAVAGPEALHRVAWDAGAQSVHAVVATALYLLVLPLLDGSGFGSRVGWLLATAGFGCTVLALYVALGVWAQMVDHA
ncbi:hypothetical protein [Kitasatospora sp. NPDC002040]|uniref:hypothetical protein n=1 Tax=Kitasatospora sp. NPDC002040 TaxID=3154661 RepID=UPI00331CA7FE